jgi:RNA polymerase sigma factor (sigma-70 family)
MATTIAKPPDPRVPPPPQTPSPKTSSALADQVAACIRRHRGGDRAAMTDLTRLVTPWLHHVVRPYRLQEAASEDVVQSTLLVAFLHLPELRDPASGLSWLSVVARRQALRTVRTERQYVAAGDLPQLHLLPAPGDGPEEAVLAALSQVAVRRAAAKLPPRYRVLLERLVQSDDPAYTTISAELRMPLGSIGPTRRRALERMRRLLLADPEWDNEVPA